MERELRANDIKLKVIYGEKSETFSVNRKTDSLEHLLRLVVKEFKLEDEGIEIGNCRLRSFNVVNEVLSDTFTGREKRNFDTLKIFNMKTMALEVKEPEEIFEEYDPNLINLKIYVWNSGI